MGTYHGAIGWKGNMDFDFRSAIVLPGNGCAVAIWIQGYDVSLML